MTCGLRVPNMLRTLGRIMLMVMKQTHKKKPQHSIQFKPELLTLNKPEQTF